MISRGLRGKFERGWHMGWVLGRMSGDGAGDRDGGREDRGERLPVEDQSNSGRFVSNN